jgi:hypothetical protein
MYALLWRAMRALLERRLDAVEPLSTELLAYAAHEPNVVNLHLGQLFWLRREQGRLGELRPALVDALAANPNIPAFRVALAFIDACAGDAAAGRAHLDRLAADGFSALPRDATWPMTLAVLAEVAVVAGARDHAATLAELLAPRSGTLVVAIKGLACLGAADRYLGMLDVALGRGERAQSRFAAAAALEGRAGCPLLAERTASVAQRALALEAGDGDPAELVDEVRVRQP